MKGLATLIKLTKRKLDELRRKMVALENEKAQLQALAQSLVDEMAREMLLVSQTVEMANYFGNFAKKMKVRQQKVADEIAAVDRKIEALSAEIAEAFSELKKYEIAQENAKRRAEEEAARKETIALDEIASQQFHRSTEST